MVRSIFRQCQHTEEDNALKPPQNKINLSQINAQIPITADNPEAADEIRILNTGNSNNSQKEFKDLGTLRIQAQKNITEVKEKDLLNVEQISILVNNAEKELQKIRNAARTIQSIFSTLSHWGKDQSIPICMCLPSKIHTQTKNLELTRKLEEVSVMLDIQTVQMSVKEKKIQTQENTIESLKEEIERLKIVKNEI
ncbi:uncharacterized protein NEPG_01877 [Nematocida parisii ERTm1]|uniref:Uncharacterized protein n=1 Tax=Nematocida parisii (strain ERTm3) TaxID=935791 RepID=I3EI64_NEMP3|nr:uncharacterized protein NEPG_01877 [Nematocida parisii ERTm1]EIJ88911.1 hypothetical protein NEQG_00730 [Nematocida parisii ERTm3]EIJ93535.1 hypothetical protein NEPG_01877 [Nematocida parisii ERTm1]KAI5143694.1 hypothetical protein NEPAR07_0792 [Nematocida parisii]KAI5156481.1 hypothetical protein NEPAR05_0611 [Nematocida parisii]|eukprot:XP_013059705.1 hypothetical protein NEPG_01877 [Nematocida parisii ERTm1]